MGIPFGRDYREILDDFSDALQGIERFYEAFDMTDEEWSELGESEQKACVRTLADDLIYGLGTEPHLSVADSMVRHDAKRHLIRIDQGDAVTRIIHLM